MTGPNPRGTPLRGRGGGGPQRGAPSRGGGPRGGGPRGGGPARGGAPPPQGGSVQIASHVQAIGIKRPSFGTAGRRLRLQVNAAEVTIPDGSVYHYDVSIEPVRPPKVNLCIIKTLQNQNASVFTPRVSYDGRKNAFGSHRLNIGPDDMQTFSVVVDQSTNPNRPPLAYRVTLKLVNEISLDILDEFINGRMTHTSEVQTAITALNVVLRMELIQRYPFNTRSFYTPEGKRPVGYGLELWRGYFQSIRPTIGRMLINLDISTGMFYAEGQLINLCLDFLGRNGQNPNLLAPANGFPERARINLQRFVVGMKVGTTTPEGVRKIHTIRGLSQQGANALTFDLNGQPSTIAAYYQSTNRTLSFPNVICVKTASKALIPLEKCIVLPGQIARKEVPPEIRNDLLAFSSQKPEDRFQSIQNGIPLLQYGQSDYIRQFGMDVNTTNFPLEIEGRVLDPPDLEYASRNSVTPRFGTWNMIDKRFIQPATIKVWMLIIYESRGAFNDANIQSVVRDFNTACGQVGVTVQQPNPYVRYENAQGGQNAIVEGLKAAGQACRAEKKDVPNLVMVILPNNGNDIYRAVKFFGNVAVGVTTQCLIGSKCKRANLQYWANVLLKVNPKMNGVNWKNKMSMVSDPNTPTVIMGADVIHPSPGAQSSPSFSSLVCGVDSNAVFYVARDRMQAPRQEIIDDLQEMSQETLSDWRDYQSKMEGKGANPSPKRLIFFRDGVSEGQFEQVLSLELPKLKQACINLKMNPKITFIVVGKRHHTRFCPANDRDKDRSGNCPAGTVVDREIIHPVEFDFFLQSHPGLKGTSRPAHYTVLYDDNIFSPDSIQNLCYSLCHVFARSTRAVSVPAPVYYADIVCTHSKLRFNPTVAMSESGSTTSVDTTQLLEQFAKQWRPTHVNMSKKMYYI